VDVQIHVFFASALVGGQWSASGPSRFSSGKGPTVPIGWEVGWTPEPVWSIWRSENSLPYRDSYSDSRVVQPVGSHYTDYITKAHYSEVMLSNETMTIVVYVMIIWKFIWIVILKFVLEV
jgi:hypothetical protein